jgi:nucleoid DNA-binding protein|tara:strand:+ start:487 stop:771 length:285 start_codon:yes stop_codon:yes gene_type:complete
LVKSEIVKQLKINFPTLKISQIEIIIDLLIDNISKSLINKKSVELRKWGTFSVKSLSAKKSARDPRTGDLIYVEPKNKIRFKASKTLNEFVNKK